MKIFKECGQSGGNINLLMQGGCENGVLKDSRVRRLTPTECERLQGFPDGWTAEGVEGKISDSQRYKCLGNAVTTNVIKAIITKLQ